MRLYLSPRLIFPFLLAGLFTVTYLTTNAQATQYLVDDPPEAQLAIPDLEVKVVWVDESGKKQRTKGYLMYAFENRLMVREITASGRNEQHTFPVSAIHKIKYSRPYNEVNDVLYGAADGLLSGGFVPIQTGNVYLDLASGLVQGALGGLFGTLGNSTSVVIGGDTNIYQRQVLPDLRPAPVPEPIVVD